MAPDKPVVPAASEKPATREVQEKKAKPPQGEVEGRVAALDARYRALYSKLYGEAKTALDALLQQEPSLNSTLERKKFDGKFITYLRQHLPANPRSRELAQEFLKRCDLVLELNAVFRTGKEADRQNMADLSDGSGRVWAALDEYRGRKRAILREIDASIAQLEVKHGITPPQPAVAPSPAPSRSAFDASPPPLPGPEVRDVVSPAVAVEAPVTIPVFDVNASTKKKFGPEDYQEEDYGYQLGQTRTRFLKESRPGADDGFKYTQIYEGNGVWALVQDPSAFRTMASAMTQDRIALLPKKEWSPPVRRPGQPLPDGSLDLSTNGRALRTIAWLAAHSPTFSLAQAKYLVSISKNRRWTQQHLETLDVMDRQVREIAAREGIPQSIVDAVTPRNMQQTRQFLERVIHASRFPDVSRQSKEPLPSPEGVEKPVQTQFDAPKHEGLPERHPTRPRLKMTRPEALGESGATAARGIASPEMTPSQAFDELKEMEAQGIASPEKEREATPSEALDEWKELRDQGLSSPDTVISEKSEEGAPWSLGTILEKLGAWWKGLWGEKKTEAAVSIAVSAEAIPEQQTPVLHELTEAEKQELIQGYSKAYGDIDNYQQGKIAVTDMTGVISSWEVMSAKETQLLTQGLSSEEIQKATESGMLRLPLQKKTVGTVAIMEAQDYEALKAEVEAHIKKLGGTVPEPGEETQG